jgi:hypothetical protein
MPQPLRPVNGLGQDAPATSQDGPATTPCPLARCRPWSRRAESPENHRVGCYEWRKVRILAADVTGESWEGGIEGRICKGLEISSGNSASRVREGAGGSRLASRLSAAKWGESSGPVRLRLGYAGTSPVRKGCACVTAWSGELVTEGIGQAVRDHGDAVLAALAKTDVDAAAGEVEVFVCSIAGVTH